MKRLTKRNPFDGIIELTKEIGEPIAPYNEVIEALSKLAAYEDLEEQGRLLVLPCKVGDTVYRIETAPNGKQAKPAYPKYTVYAYSVFTVFGEEYGINTFVRQLNKDGTPMSSYEVFKSSIFGKTVFLTREEAEEKLKERDGK